MTESAVLLTLREQQRQKERAEKKRLLYVALTRARDHLFMSGTAPDEAGLSYDLARSRIEWIFTALGITGDAISSGVLPLELPDGTGSITLTIISDPEAIPAETGRIEPSLIVIPEECAEKTGSWTAPKYSIGPERVKVVSVSELEKTEQEMPIRTPGTSIYLPGVNGTTKGTIIHEVLRGRDAATVLKEYGEYSEEHVRQCKEIVSRFHSSDLMKRVKREYCELPFIVTIDGKGVTGKIDRLCELEDGTWVVIDYKSEVVSPIDSTLKAGEYAASMGAYIEAAEHFFGGKKVEGWFYFTETGDFYRD